MASTQSAQKLNLAEVTAIGVGGMVGGGIFAVLGLAMTTAGHAVAIALALSGVLALLTGYSFAYLGLAFRDDGGSFTYIQHAFKSASVAGVAGWLLVAGYVGTLALYATAFGAYGAAMLAGAHAASWMEKGLALLVLGVFLGVNLAGAKTSGRLELVIVVIKVLILAVFAAAGLYTFRAGLALPVFDKGFAAPVVAAGLIFVAYEGFELIPNAIEEMRNPEKDLKRGLMLSIVITTVIYVVVALVALGNLTPPQIAHDQEYVLAVAAKPTLGQFGFALIGVAALMSTASAINATLFGSSRLAMAMARDHALPRIFSTLERTRPVPWVALVVLTGATVAFTLLADLTVISTFASATFLIIFAAVNLAAWRLRKKIGIRAVPPMLGVVLSLGALGALFWHVWRTDPTHLDWLVGFYALAVVLEAVLTLVRGHRKARAS